MALVLRLADQLSAATAPVEIVSTCFKAVPAARCGYLELSLLVILTPRRPGMLAVERRQTVRPRVGLLFVLMQRVVVFLGTKVGPNCKIAVSKKRR